MTKSCNLQKKKNVKILEFTQHTESFDGVENIRGLSSQNTLPVRRAITSLFMAERR
jgi:hypothetical protein